MTNEERRLEESRRPATPWKKWGPYLSERQDAEAIVTHLRADPEYQRRSARFLENHDEPRAAATFAPDTHRAAAVLALLAPGLRFVHEGQLTGRRVRASNHLRRRAPEPIDRELESFYGRLLAIMRREEVREGQWQLLDREPASNGDASWRQLVAFSWERADRRLPVVVNWGRAALRAMSARDSSPSTARRGD